MVTLSAWWTCHFCIRAWHSQIFSLANKFCIILYKWDMIAKKIWPKSTCLIGNYTCPGPLRSSLYRCSIKYSPHEIVTPGWIFHIKYSPDIFFVHWKLRVVMMRNLTSLALEVVVMATHGATSDDKVGIMITLFFSCRWAVICLCNSKIM